jgi:hypothetical protein
MSIHVEFPEELLVASREDLRVFTRKVMIYTFRITTEVHNRDQPR